MKMKNPHAESLNPRHLLKKDGSEVLARLLADTGYIVQERVLNDMCQSIKSGMPHLIEGERGSGKTALAEALADACNLPVFYLQGMEGLGLEDVLYSWDREGQAQWVRQALDVGMSLEEVRARQWSADYLVLGEALGAYEFAGREDALPILIIDEVDKLKDCIEDMLLQLFARGFAHVPRFGDVGVLEPERWPVVVLLSNDIRHDLSAPLRSRCIYTWIDKPTAREEVSILYARVPEASAAMVGCVAKMLDCVRNILGVDDKPALREGIAFLSALLRDGVKHVDAEVLKNYLCYLAKRHNDRDYLLGALFRVEEAMNASDREIDKWVRQEFERMRRPVLEAVA